MKTPAVILALAFAVVIGYLYGHSAGMDSTTHDAERLTVGYQQLIYRSYYGGCVTGVSPNDVASIDRCRALSAQDAYRVIVSTGVPDWYRDKGARELLEKLYPQPRSISPALSSPVTPVMGLFLCPNVTSPNMHVQACITLAGNQAPW